MNTLFNVKINDISVIYVTAHRCADGLKKKLDLRSGSQRHRRFVGFFNVPVLAPTREKRERLELSASILQSMARHLSTSAFIYKRSGDTD